MGRDKPGHPRKARGLAERPADHPTNLWRDVPPSCLAASMQPAGVADPTNQLQMAQARQATHDLAIAHAGTARVSGVQWVTVPAAEAIPKLERLWDDSTTENDRAVVSGLRAFLEATPGSVIVMASCWVDTRIANAWRS